MTAVPVSAAPGAAQADVRPAATVVLLRDGPGGEVEVFLMRRHGASGFMAGATVFPGGKVDAADRAAAAAGRTPEACARLLGETEPTTARAFFVAAGRELHEESHVLLARRPDGRLPAAAEVAQVDDRLDGLRDGHRLASRAWFDTLAAAGLVPALDLLVPFAHWVTPAAEPRRFDTYFFAAACPPGQVAAQDVHEATHAFWSTPAAALAEHAAGGATLLPPPTLHTLQRLQALPGPAAAVLDALEEAGVGPRIEPWFLGDSEQGPAIVLPDDPLHPDHVRWLAEHAGRTDVPERPRRNRFLLQQGRFNRDFEP